jgi:hypothetical protein
MALMRAIVVCQAALCAELILARSIQIRGAATSTPSHTLALQLLQESLA